MIHEDKEDDSEDVHKNTMNKYLYNDTLKEFLESTKAFKFQDPFEELRESMKTFKFQDPFKELRESMKTLQLPNSIKDILSSISANKWPLAYEDSSDLQINEDGTISIGSDSVNHDQLKSIVHQVVSSTFNGRTIRIEQAIDRVISKIGSLKEPFIQKILTWLIFPLIVGIVLSVVMPIADYYIKETLSSGEKRLIVKQVRKIITSKVENKSYLYSFRIVSANTLNVRKSGYNKSAKVGVLYFGEVVEVLQKGRKWSLVKWHNEESKTSLQGWVLSRYLKRIK